MLYCAWRYGGEDPWRLYNRLDGSFRPVWAPELPEVRPANPDRYQRFLYACGKVAAILDEKMKDQGPSPAPKTRRERPAVLGPDGKPISWEG